MSRSELGQAAAAPRREALRPDANRSMMKLLSVVGARPQLIKAAVVSRALAARGSPTELIVHTGQHFDESMSDAFFSELRIPQPAYNLGIRGGSHGEMTGRMIAGIEAVLVTENPDAVVVYGDTNSTLAGALAAAKLQIPIAHVEAGLRSFNRRMPEEINRVLTDHLCDALYCPTSSGAAHLRREGITEGVSCVGDVMYDAALEVSRGAIRSDVLSRYGLTVRCYAVATVHRAENTSTRDALNMVLAFLDEQTARGPVILPLHPRTRLAAGQWGMDFGRITVVPPLGYGDMASLVAGARTVYTDSGGLQKEAYFHRVPCVTLRDETEWVETITAGWNRLWRVPDYLPRKEIHEYGDGTAGTKIAELLGQLCERRKELT